MLLLILNSILLLSAVVVLRWAVKRWASHVLANLRSPELVLLFVLAMLGAVTYGAYQVGLPPALGAFAAGLIFNGNRLTAQVDALVLPFRQTFAAMFFVSLGLLLQPGILGAGILSLLLMLAIVFVLKGAAGLIALRLTGLSWKASAGMGVGLAHLGEFSLVLGLTGMTAGVIPQDDYQRLLCVALASLILTPFLLKLGLRWTEPSFPETDEAAPASHGIARWSPHTAVVIGAGPIGRQVTSQLETIGCNVCLIDLSPVNLHPFALQGIHTVAGDARDPAVLRNAGVRDAELLVLSLPDDRVAIHVLRAVREVNTKAMSVVRCRYQNNEQHLREAGAEHVISEEVLAAGAVLRLLRQLENELPVSQQVARKAASQVSAEGG